MKKNNTLLTIVALLMLSGCASIVNGQSQSVSINTTPESGATCELTNNDGTWFVPASPASVVVERSASDLVVICKKNDISGTAVVASHTKAMAFGNIVFGGVIGAAVDAGTGAAFDYPSLITVPMAKGGKTTTIAPPPAEKKDTGEMNS